MNIAKSNFSGAFNNCVKKHSVFRNFALYQKDTHTLQACNGHMLTVMIVDGDEGDSGERLIHKRVIREAQRTRKPEIFANEKQAMAIDFRQNAMTFSQVGPLSGEYDGPRWQSYTREEYKYLCTLDPQLLLWLAQAIITKGHYMAVRLFSRDDSPILAIQSTHESDKGFGFLMPVVEHAPRGGQAFVPKLIFPRGDNDD